MHMACTEWGCTKNGSLVLVLEGRPQLVPTQPLTRPLDLGQIERLAMTEPVEVDLLRLVRWAGRHALDVCGGTLRAAAELATEAARRVRRAEELEPRDRDDWR